MPTTARSSLLRRWLRPPRRLLFTRPGAVFTAGILAVGLAAVNTGNNLLYLLLGALLGVVAVSGWLSEQALRRVEVARELPRGAPAGQPARIRYRVTNRGSRLPVITLEIREPSLAGSAFLPLLSPGATAVARNSPVFVRRGTVPLETVTLSTAFPFGLFRKERDLEIPGELVVWPSTERPVRLPATAGPRSGRGERLSVGRGSHRGHYRSLRDYASGDDPRDVHWKATARGGGLVVREYEPEAEDALWVCLDAAGLPGDAAEAAVETAASLAARGLRGGLALGFATQGHRFPPAPGDAQLERILDVLARLDFRPDLPPLLPPAGGERCVLVTASGRRSAGFGVVHAVVGSAS